jgi:hypothetical protein
MSDGTHEINLSGAPVDLKQASALQSLRMTLRFDWNDGAQDKLELSGKGAKYDSVPVQRKRGKERLFTGVIAR